MSNPRIAKWDARYADGDLAPSAAASPLLRIAVAGAPPGRALDLACGAGRHAVWLAGRGWRVDAVDGSAAGIELLLARAERAGCRARVTPHVANLESDPPAFDIPEGAYDLIVDCFFLHRPLFARIRGGVRPGGRFAAALHLPAPGGGRGHGHVLESGELQGLTTGWGWTLLHAAERGTEAGESGLGIAEVVARRPVSAQGHERTPSNRGRPRREPDDAATRLRGRHLVPGRPPDRRAAAPAWASARKRYQENRCPTIPTAP